MLDAREARNCGLHHSVKIFTYRVSHHPNDPAYGTPGVSRRCQNTKHAPAPELMPLASMRADGGHLPGDSGEPVMV